MSYCSARVCSYSVCQLITSIIFRHRPDQPTVRFKPAIPLLIKLYSHAHYRLLETRITSSLVSYQSIPLVLCLLSFICMSSISFRSSVLCLLCLNHISSFCSILSYHVFYPSCILIFSFFTVTISLYSASLSIMCLLSSLLSCALVYSTSMTVIVFWTILF